MPQRAYIKKAQRYNKQYAKPAIVVATRALAVANAVSKLVNVEYKSIRVTVPASPDNTPVVTPISAPAQGDDFDDRDGRKIKLFSYRVQGRVTMNASASGTIYRMVILRDNNGSTTRPVVTDVYPDAAAFNSGIMPNDDPQTNARFSILSDKRYLIANGGREMANITIYRRLNSHAYFTGTGANDEGKGMLYMFTGSNEATNVPTVGADVVVKWIDN